MDLEIHTSSGVVCMFFLLVILIVAMYWAFRD